MSTTEKDRWPAVTIYASGRIAGGASRVEED